MNGRCFNVTTTRETHANKYRRVLRETESSTAAFHYTHTHTFPFELWLYFKVYNKEALMRCFSVTSGSNKCPPGGAISRFNKESNCVGVKILSRIEVMRRNSFKTLFYFVSTYSFPCKIWQLQFRTCILLQSDTHSGIIHKKKKKNPSIFLMIA